MDSRILAKNWLPLRNHQKRKRYCRKFGESSDNQSREKLSDVLTSERAKIVKKAKTVGPTVPYT